MGGVGAADLAAVIGSPVEQSVAGPEMSEWIFQANVGTDADLHVRFYVRLFADGRIAILPSIGNGYVNTGPGRKVGRVVVTVDRAVRYDSGTDLTIYHHQRIAVPQTNGDWHWIGGDPQVTPRHDTQYLRATKFVPNYMATSVNRRVSWARSRKPSSPQALCDLPGNQLGGGGDHPSIGYLPHWEACFVASGGDSRAYRATILNSFATGVYSYHYPDAKSRRPFRYSEWPAASRPARSGGEQYLSGQYGFEFDLSHEWPPGFLAYVLTGDRWHLEELQHNVGWGWLFLGTARVVNGQRIYDREISSRGVSWGLRNLMLALASTPDGDVLRTEFAINYGANASYWNGIGPLQKFPLGWRDQMETYSVYQGTYFDGRGTKAFPFTWEFGSYCFGWAVDLEIGASLPAQQSSDLSAWTAHCLAAATKWFGGGDPNEYNYRYAGVYQTWVGSDTSWPLDPATYFTTGGQAFAAQFGRQNGSDLVTDSRIMHYAGGSDEPCELDAEVFLLGKRAQLLRGAHVRSCKSCRCRNPGCIGCVVKNQSSPKLEHVRGVARERAKERNRAEGVDGTDVQPAVSPSNSCAAWQGRVDADPRRKRIRHELGLDPSESMDEGQRCEHEASDGFHRAA